MLMIGILGFLQGNKIRNQNGNAVSINRYLTTEPLFPYQEVIFFTFIR